MSWLLLTGAGLLEIVWAIALKQAGGFTRLWPSLIGEWEDLAALKGARDQMIATLNSFRDTLEDLGGGLGVTDAVSGEVVVDLRA